MDEASTAALFGADETTPFEVWPVAAGPEATARPAATARPGPAGPEALGPSPDGFDFLLDDLPAIRKGLARLLRGFDNNRGIREAQRFQEWAASLETSLLAEKARDGADERSLRRMAGAGGTRSRAEVERRKRRARTAAKNPDLVKPGDESPGGNCGSPNDSSPNSHTTEAGEDGLNSGQLDALGWADTRTGGAAALDADLVKLLSKLSADQAMREARRYVDQHDKDENEKLQERQRVRRRAYRSTEGEFERITIEGDKPSVDEIWARIEAEAGRLYHEDGGRGVPVEQHPRTRSQRLFDAAAGFFTQTTAISKSTARTVASRATLVLTTSIENAAAGFPDPVELIGTGPVSREFFSRLLPDTDWVGLLYGENGHPLWLGRSVRNATFPQWLALAVRDRGCVQCGAAASRCEAHHTMPWEAPGRGETNVDQMCLLCSDCHRQLHHNNQTLEWDREIKRWRARAALPHEIPPTSAKQARQHV